ncbi:MAG: nucleotide kinase domain-containing protein [Candidatus Cryptobacteroides sp.]
MANRSIVTNDAVFRYYFYFIQERMNIFWNKYKNAGKLTDDPILQTYKFTNVYRACDRVSQYLIRNVIYKDLGKYTPEDILLRILVFKVFNKIETWEYLNNENVITAKTFNVQTLTKALTRRQQITPIFSNAYMMAGSHSDYKGISTKHQVWLQMIEDRFIKDKGIQKVLNAKSLAEVYTQLREYPLIGDFLAYQYAIDFNYSPYLNFDEDSFVKAGVGAIRGIKKCFASYGNTYEDAIRYTHDHFYILQERYGFTAFRPLPARDLKLIDLQNCFCETDKYLRAKMPELKVGNVRIKQLYKPSANKIDYYFPAKWGISL